MVQLNNMTAPFCRPVKDSLLYYLSCPAKGQVSLSFLQKRNCYSTFHALQNGRLLQSGVVIPSRAYYYYDTGAPLPPLFTTLIGLAYLM
jgi:hypothetical protein